MEFLQSLTYRNRIEEIKCSIFKAIKDVVSFKGHFPIKFLRQCSRKNLVFLCGELINLTVRVDAYFHPIMMTNPIQPEPFSQAAPNWGKPV